MDDCNGGGCNIACNGFQRAPLGQRHSPAYGEPLDKEALSYGTALRRSLTPVSKGGLVRDGEARLVAKATRPFRCLGANAAFFELTGYAQAEVDAASIRLLQQPESTSAWDSAIQAAKGGGKHDLQTICQLAHGKQAMLRVQVSMLPLTADEAERHKLADTSEQLLLFVVWLAPVLRMAQDAVHNSSPGARVIVKNRAPFHIENVNADWTSMFGMPEASVVGRSLQVVQGPFTDSRALRQLMDLAARGVEGKATFIAYNIDGKKFLTNHTTWPLVSTAGTIESFVAEVQAVEVVDLQEALKVQIGFVAVVAMPGTKNEASEHRIAHATGELCSFVGSEGGEVVGHAVSKMIGLANTEALVKSMAQLMRGDFRGRPSLVVSLYCADDKVVPVRAEMLPVVDSHGRLSNVMLTFHPCQVDTLADALVRQRTSGVAEFISTAKSPFMMKQASDAWCRIYALTPNEVNGRSLQIIHGPSTDQSLLHKVIGDALAGQPITERITCYQKDGSEVTASITIFPIMSEHGAIDHVRAVVDDVQFASAQARDAWIKSNCQQHVCATNEGTGEDAVMMESAGEDAVAMNGCKDSIDCAMGGASCLESREDGKIEYPMTPEGHIVHINGYTQLVLYPKADPTLEHCLVYMEHLRDANIVKSWQWEGDALRGLLLDLNVEKLDKSGSWGWR
jgi:PAS domain S-box-containing protein